MATTKKRYEAAIHGALGSVRSTVDLRPWIGREGYETILAYYSQLDDGLMLGTWRRYLDDRQRERPEASRMRGKAR